MRLSASQIQTFTECQRKWAWRIIEGVEEPPSKAAELGSLVHAELAKYLSGDDIDFTTEVGYIAASGLKHLPKPGPGLLVEQEFHFEGPSGHTYLGYKDLEEPGTVTDHKTTGDLRWQKTADELRTDIQATLYAVDYFRKHPDEPRVDLRWVYYQTKNTKKSTLTHIRDENGRWVYYETEGDTKKSAVTHIRVDQNGTWQRFLEIEKIAEEMELASKKRALDLPPSVNHCSAYGGCPHQGRCNLSPFDKMRSHMEQNKLLASLKNKKNGAAPAPSEAPAVPLAFAPGGAFADQTPPGASSTGNKLLGRLRAGGAPTAAAPAINPPEHQPPPVPPPVPVAVPTRQTIPVVAVQDTQAVAEYQKALGAELAESLQQPDATPRGRPKKAALPATGLAVKIKTLYINCGPVGVPVVDVSHLVVLAKKRLPGLADYRFAEYGQGPGMLAVAAVAELDLLEGVLPAVRLDTTPEGIVLQNDLMARAELVVR